MAGRPTHLHTACWIAVGMLLSAGCGTVSGGGSVRLLTDEVTWVSTDGHDGRIHLGVAGKTDSRDVVVRVHGAKVARFARLRPADRRCRVVKRDVECQLGAVRPGLTELFTPARVQPRRGALPKDGLELPMTAGAAGAKPVTHQTTLQIVRKATFVSTPESRLRRVAAGGTTSLKPAVMNVGSVTATNVQIAIYATDGAEYASAFRNCRPMTVGGGVLCTFRQKVPAHAAVTTDASLAFRLPQMVRGNLTYLATEGPDPESAPEYYRAAPADAPELRLVPADRQRFRSATGGTSWWGGFVDIQTGAKATIVARGTRVPDQAGRTTMLVGVENASPRIVDAIVLPKDPFLGEFTVVIPDGVTVEYIPYPGEEGWGDCSPHKRRQLRYVCRIPERLDQGQPLLQPFVVTVDPHRVGKAGSVTLHLRHDARNWDSSTTDNSAPIVVN
jgi:hypothetical protein